MTRAEKIVEAQRLRAQGLVYREIGERMGVSRKTACSWILDPELLNQRARRVRYSRPCVDCGKPTDGSGGFAQPRERCRACRDRFQHEMRYWTPEAIIGAIQCWADEHGGIPPSAKPWLTSLPVGYPPVATVQREFGTWSAAIEAAGFSSRPASTYGRDGEDMGLCQEIRERYEAGETSPRLAVEYGCNAGAIRYRIRKAGGTIRSSREAWRNWNERKARATA